MFKKTKSWSRCRSGRVPGSKALSRSGGGICSDIWSRSGCETVSKSALNYSTGGLDRGRSWIS